MAAPSTCWDLNHTRSPMSSSHPNTVITHLSGTLRLHELFWLPIYPPRKNQACVQMLHRCSSEGSNPFPGQTCCPRGTWHPKGAGQPPGAAAQPCCLEICLRTGNTTNHFQH